MMTKKIADENIEKVRKLIETHDKMVIVTHLSPDGDAVGSSLALYHFLNAIENNVTVVVPNGYPAFLSWIKGCKEIVIFDKYPDFATQLIEEAELIFCLDFNTPKRAGSMAEVLVKSKAKKVLIDHHLNPDTFCDVTISHPDISSTSELIFRLICRMGSFDLINKRCAESIYVGMMTDTGAFTYNSNNEDIYFIISQLLKKGIDKDAIYRSVYNNNSVDRVRLMGYALTEKMNIYPTYKTAIINLSLDDLNKHNYQSGDTEGVVNIPLTIKDIVCSIFVREDKEKIKLSFRSTGDFPVNKIASDHFGGGGHLNAAGGDFYGTLEETIVCIENILPEYEHLLPKE